MFFIKSQKGFTLVEMLVVIAMVGILSIFVFADFRGQSQNTLFKYTAEDILGASVQMREYSKSGKILALINQVPLGGYGIFFDVKSGLITQFADINDNGVFDEENKQEFIAYVSYNSNFKISEFYLVADEILPKDDAVNEENIIDLSGEPQLLKNKLNIIFKNPNGDMQIVDEEGQSAYSSASLGLQNNTTGQKLYINFYKKSGTISIGENVIQK